MKDMSEINTGLEGVVVAETAISHVDGKKGQLVYRDYNLQEAVKDCTYEDIAFLLCYGKRPSSLESSEFKKNLAGRRMLPDYVKHILTQLPADFGVMSALRTGLSALKIDVQKSWPPTLEQGLEVIAKTPVLIAYYYQVSQSKKIVEPDLNLSHAENYLYMLRGEKPDRSAVKAMDAYLMVCADHGMNASTFTARVISSTQSDLISAVVGAIGALKGPLHGGAPLEVDDMLDEIGAITNVGPWLRKKLESNEHIMGFGHRVYKTYDPRAEMLKAVVKDLTYTNNVQLQLSLELEKQGVELLKEYKPGRNLYPNVDFWAAVLLRTIQLPRDLYPPTFGAARSAGWVAHILEQALHNRLIRPSSAYIGKIPV